MIRFSSSLPERIVLENRGLTVSRFFMSQATLKNSFNSFFKENKDFTYYSHVKHYKQI